MADALETPVAAPAAASTPAPAAAGGAQTPAAQPAKSVDPFASLSTAEAAKKELTGDGDGDDKGDQKADDKADAAKAGDKTDPKPGDKTGASKAGEKVVAGRKDAVAEQRARIEQQNTVIERTQRERDDYKRQLEDLRKQGGGDIGALTKTVADKDKEIEHLRGELAAKDYSKHPDYEKNYEKPYQTAIANGVRVINSLEVVQKDAEGEITSRRPANWETDFAPMYGLPRAAARSRAKELFGEDAAEAMQQYDAIHQLHEQKNNALSEWQSGANEREQKTRSEQLMETKKMGDAFNAVTKDFIDSDPLFQEKPDDAARTDLWNKSQEIVDRAYFSRDKFSKPELAVLDAAVRLRAINEPVLRAELSKVRAELEEYKERIEGKEKSRNGKTLKVGETPAAGAKPEAWDRELISTLRGAV